MHAWEAIQKTLNHIEAHISEEIKIEALAEIASLSIFYYQRLFARLVKKPVREYIKLRKLAHACGALRVEQNLILDVALAYGFHSHETFTRAFKEAYGITPIRYRESAIALDNFDKPDLLLNYVMVDEGVPLISDGLVLEMRRETIPKPAYFAGRGGGFPFVHGKMLGERPGISGAEDIWEAYHKVLAEIPRIPDGRTIGVCYPGDAPVGYTSYFAGAEVAYPVNSRRFESWELPAREYVVCGFEAENPARLAPDALGKAMKFTRLWLKAHGLIAEDFFPEMYYPTTPGAAYMEIWVPFRLRNQ